MSGTKDLEKSKKKTHTSHTMQHEKETDKGIDSNPDKDVSKSRPAQEENGGDTSSQGHVGAEGREDTAGDDPLKLVHILEQENNRLKDELLRNRAELANSKKRLSKHYEEVSQNKTKQLLLDIVILLDNFERAFESLNNVENISDTTSMIEGIKMIESQFIKTLETKWNVRRYNSIDNEFNPSLHEAMMTEVVNTLTQPTVVEEFSKGYMFNDKVLRSAKVKVAMPETSM